MAAAADATTPATGDTESLYTGLALLPPNKIFGLLGRCRADPDPAKMDLSIGAYRDASLKPYVFSVVRKVRLMDGQSSDDVPGPARHGAVAPLRRLPRTQAEALLLARGLDKEYLPIHGLAGFRECARELVFGAESPASREGRIMTVQTVSGTGSLRVGAEFLRRVAPTRPVLLPSPTWSNHKSILLAAGFPASHVKTYTYYNPRTLSLDFEGLLASLEAADEGSVVLLHACAHNPTGIDPDKDQWRAIAELCVRRKLLPWFDLAYQGFASGDLNEDAWSVRTFTDAYNLPCLVSQSFSKCLGLYCERVGALHVVTASPKEAAAVGSHLERVIRPMYSNPPAQGARIVETVLRDPELRTEWEEELRAASTRLHAVRATLRTALEERATPGSWANITASVGLFAYLDLSPAQCARLVEEEHAYLLDSGRISVAGLNTDSARRFADAIHRTVTTPLPERFAHIKTIAEEDV